MGICQSKYRMELQIILKRIKDFKVENDYLTPMEILQFREVQKKCEEILKEFDNCAEYLNSK